MKLSWLESSISPRNEWGGQGRVSSYVPSWVVLWGFLWSGPHFTCKPKLAIPSKEVELPNTSRFGLIKRLGQPPERLFLHKSQKSTDQPQFRPKALELVWKGRRNDKMYTLFYGHPVTNTAGAKILSLYFSHPSRKILWLINPFIQSTRTKCALHEYTSQYNSNFGSCQF